MAGPVPRVSGSALMDKPHGVGSPRVRDVGASPGHEQEPHTVRHHNSVFHDLSKRVPWAASERLAQAHGADHRVRRLPTKSQFTALLHGQLAGAASLRDVVDSLRSHAGRLYHVGGRPPRLRQARPIQPHPSAPHRSPYRQPTKANLAERSTRPEMGMKLNRTLVAQGRP